MNGEAEEGFLARWSRRKRDAAAEPAPQEEPQATPAAEPDAPPPADPAPPPAGGEAAAPRRAACPIPNLPEVDLASLPRIEELTAQSDFSVFLRPGVPQLLRNAALRRMWSLDPVIRNYIGPVEYQWDFNAPGGLPLGFGNELAGDVGRLLAQAIGKVEALTRPEADAPADPVVLPAPAEAEAASSPARLSEQESVSDAGQDATEHAPALPVTPDRTPARRRHGGALPA